MEKAVFLDRDGVINKERDGYTWKVEDFILNADLMKALHVFTDAGFRIIVISNQSGIAKGLYTKDDVLACHRVFLQACRQEGIPITGFYFCPHHPDYGKCLCRKPQPLMLQKALARWNIDPRHSFMIGDRIRDVEAAEGAGIKGILVSSNASLLPVADQILFGL